MRYTVNGRTYDSLEAMPKDDRAVFERMRGLVDDPELLGGAELVDGESPMLGWTPPQAAPERAAGEGVGRRALELLSDVEIESARERMRAELGAGAHGHAHAHAPKAARPKRRLSLWTLLFAVAALAAAGGWLLRPWLERG